MMPAIESGTSRTKAGSKLSIRSAGINQTRCVGKKETEAQNFRELEIESFLFLGVGFSGGHMADYAFDNPIPVFHGLAGIAFARITFGSYFVSINA
jgi:hypothetical protein